eukprot:9489945-Alexandrium_andersonii.AAC.1
MQAKLRRDPLFVARAKNQAAVWRDVAEPESDRQFEDLRRWQATIGTGISRWDCRSRLCAFLFGRQWSHA